MGWLHHIFQTARTLIFYLGTGIFTIFWVILCFIVAPFLSQTARFKFVSVAWNKVIITWARITCGIKYEIIGAENIPDTPCVILSKHQCMWETFFLQTLFIPQATLLKKELLNVPFFGWAFRLINPIAIDRSNPRKALTSLIQQGKARLQEGVWVLIFPEGTRVPPGQKKEFAKGGAMLAAKTETPVLPIALNAGEYWRSDSIAKVPGTIKIVIGPVIEAKGKKAGQIHEESITWIQNKMKEISNIPTPD